MEFRPRQLRLYLVLDPELTRHDPVELARDAIRAGVTCVQLRWKSATDRQIVTLGRELSVVARQHGIPLILNDRLDLAVAIGAEGVHLGVDDLPLEDARRIAGPRFIVGYSPETDEQAAAAQSRGATYLGIGPFFDTGSKADAGAALGPSTFSKRRGLTALPVVAIGGIHAGVANVPIQAGATGVAVVSAICGADDVTSATLALARAVNREI